MRVISRRALREFWEVYPQAKSPLCAWFRIMEHSTFPDLSALKSTFGTADYVAPYTVFDVGGNKFRVITAIHYNRERVYVRKVLTHADYDRWSTEMRRGKTRRGSK
jgi:mRNA interferase HigB